MLDRLRPRWRHSDPDVRAAAVREMAAADQARLATIARSDPDERVRRLAIRKLEDARVLEGLAASEPDAALRAVAAERLREVAVAIASSPGPLADCEAALARLADEPSLAAVATAAAHEGVRRAALGRVSGERVLRDLVRHAGDPALRRAALDRIHDPGLLRSIAVGDVPADLALRALERITDADTLRAVADGDGGSKSVRQRARGLLASLPDDRPAVGHKEGRTRQLALCVAVEAMTLEPDAAAAAERVRDAQREWDALARDVPPRAEAAARFAAACEAVLDDAASRARRRAEAERARTALEEGVAARLALCERLEAVAAADGARAVEDARAAWSRLSALDDERATALSRRFAAAAEDAAARHRRWLAGEASRAQLAALVAEAEALAEATPLPDARAWQAVEKRWAARDPSDAAEDAAAALEARLASARERLDRRRLESEERESARRRENLQRLERLCARLADLAAAETLKLGTARRELQAAEAALATLGPLPSSERPAAWRQRLAEARDQLLRRSRQEEETEEWRRWANAGAQEDLIRRVEALLESNDLAEGTRQLGRLQEEWASVASATPERAQALWERFRTARNELRRRCDAYLADNLERKRALCAQVADAGESTDWNATAERIKRLQAEWKAIGPVPGRHAKAIWDQFRAPCDRFFERRKEHFDRLDAGRRDSAARKTALCEQAEALGESTDWDAATAAVKRLQAEWKQTGPVARAQSEALWQRFRAACDRVFDRSRRRDELAREAALERAQAICAEVEALAAALATGEEPAAGSVGQAMDAAWAEWLRLGLAAAGDARAAADRLHAACERVVAARPETLRETRLAGEAALRRREKLCARLESLAGADAEPPRPPSLQEMALALRERLAANTIAGPAGGRAGRRQEIAREVERIVASWTNLGPALDPEGRALAERFERARARARGPA